MSKIDFSTSSSAQFLSVQRWRGGAEWHPTPHSHKFWEILIVVAGAERVTVNGRSLVAEAGDIMLYPPGARHDERIHNSSVIEFYCVWFEWPDAPVGGPRCIRDRQGRVHELARWLHAEELPVYQGSREYMQILTRMIVAEVVRLMATPSQEIVDQVRRFVRDHIDEPFTLDDLAAYCQLNKYYLVRKFRALTGLSPMEYVRQVRLDIAVRNVIESDLPLRELAPRVGFANEYHLSRLLKKRYGVGVREIRQRRSRNSKQYRQE